ncbi:type-F conjugative transfer system pilin assembly protein TrbC [Rickettsia argasii]|uniref:Type-F conjugative transfer system pilin assembly protein TrbC n=1 Tax=Rickettsia argasii T170-B TaxID=1268837 RepID=A0A0F3RC49_9RICK|nr:type-F conjugative transfer system pilin assembly protein TrbC [Rickettsia argasii]KJW03853.1 type-F conjugative transfer system pilin assembly protein TrbC [Rickettsia argasii T170-B]
MQFNLKTIILTSLLILGSTNVLAEQEELLQEIIQPKTYNQIYIFISFSMPDSALKSYYVAAERAGAKLVMRGLKNNSFLDTKAQADEIGISFDINPNLFEKYQITSVPAIIVNSEDKGVKKLTGHISLHDALEIMNKENS